MAGARVPPAEGESRGTPVISQSDPGRVVINTNTLEMLLRCFIRAPSPTVYDLRVDYNNYLHATCGFIDARGHRIYHIVDHRKLLCYNGACAVGVLPNCVIAAKTAHRKMVISSKEKPKNPIDEKQTIIIDENKTKFTIVSRGWRPQNATTTVACR